MPLERGVCHLSWLYVTIKLLAVYPPASDEQPYCAGIHNLTTHKTYRNYVAIATRELLPHLFTLTSEEAVIFCYATLPLRIASR